MYGIYTVRVDLDAQLVILEELISKLCPQYREMLDEDHRSRIKK